MLSLGGFVGRDPTRLRLTARIRFFRFGNTPVIPLATSSSSALLQTSGAESDLLVFAADFASLRNIYMFYLFKLFFIFFLPYYYSSRFNSQIRWVDAFLGSCENIGRKLLVYRSSTSPVICIVDGAHPSNAFFSRILLAKSEIFNISICVLLIRLFICKLTSGPGNLLKADFPSGRCLELLSNLVAPGIQESLLAAVQAL